MTDSMFIGTHLRTSDMDLFLLVCLLDLREGLPTHLPAPGAGTYGKLWLQNIQCDLDGDCRSVRLGGFSVLRQKDTF